MILDKKALSLAELRGYVKDLEGKDELNKYLKKFGKISKDKAEKVTKGVEALENPKIKSGDIVKIIDFQPQDMEDVNKIFTDSSLNEEEANALAEIVKK
jgi:DNA-directed RNA polymerase subunit F